MNAIAESTKRTARTIVALNISFSGPLLVVEIVPVPPNVEERPELLFWINMATVSIIATIA